MSELKLRELTTIHDETGENVTAVRFRVSDHPDHAQSKEWIRVQVALDTQTIRNGAILRAEALEKARDVLDTLARDFDRLGRTVR